MLRGKLITLNIYTIEKEWMPVINNITFYIAFLENKSKLKPK